MTLGRKKNCARSVRSVYLLNPLLYFTLLLAGYLSIPGNLFAKSAPDSESVMLVIMDPLARELACACVKGFGQRDYRKLAAQFQKAIKQPNQKNCIILLLPQLT